MKQKTRTFSLKSIVAATLCIGILLVSALHMYQAYEGMKTGILLATQTAAQHLAESVNQNLRTMMIPSDLTLRLMKHADLSSAKDFGERIEGLALLREALDSNSICSAVYVGYENGDFFMLSKFEGNNSLVVAPPPEETRYLLQSVTLQKDGTRLGELRFYGLKLDLLEKWILEDYAFDPRTRPWYKNSISSDVLEITPPYIFYSTREIGVSLATKSAFGHSVVGLDATAGDLSEFLVKLSLTPASEVAIIAPDGRTVAYPDVKRLLIREGDAFRLPLLGELGISALDSLHSANIPDNALTRYGDGVQDWYGFKAPVDGFANKNYKILITIPGSELLAGAWNNLVLQGYVSTALMLLLLVIGWRLGTRLVRPLQILTEQVNSLAEFDFQAPIGVPTRVSEVRQLGRVLGDMAKTIQGFQSLSLALNRERDLEHMLAAVLEQLLNIVQLESGGIYLYDEKEGRLRLTVSKGEGLAPEIPVSSPKVTDEQLLPKIAALVGGDDISAILRDRSQAVLGLLLIRSGNSDARLMHKTLEPFVNGISSSAAVAIETRQLIHAQKALLDSFITLIADAIDTKSPYTGGHCRRVPVLAGMIIDAVLRSEDDRFAGYAMSPVRREEFRIASWLHDCGKITTPEYVVDKATKLETINNRIHEVRTRFEVLRRDASIVCLEAIANGENEERAKAVRDAEHARLQEEFAFVADCNIGGEAMKPEDIEKLRHLSERTWMRHFDDRLGLSKDELLRMPERIGNGEPLPAVEYLLSDKQSHVVEWGDRFPPVHPYDPRNIWGFDMEIPKNMYNYGEIYNLTIPKGTLTDEERFKINDHIVQTICMLSRLPFPADLAAVPEIAGNHHERMDGKGYPRKRLGKDMSIPERVMVIADIFEALTARDRPYKDGKTLSQALGILSRMAQSGHVDKDIFNLFLRSGVYLEYAAQYLAPNQVDQIAVEAFEAF